MDNKRTFSFVAMCVTLILTIFTGYLAYAIGCSISNASGAEALTFVFTIPLTILLYLVTAALNVSTLITAIRAISSEITVFKVIAIIVLVLSVVIFILIAISVLLVLKVF